LAQPLLFKKTVMEAMIQPVNSCKVSSASQTAESLLRPAQSFKEVLQEQPVAEEENKDLGEGKVAEDFLSNRLPILPDLCLRNNLINVDPSKVQSLGQPLGQQARMIENPQAPSILSLPGIAENPQQNISAFPTAQRKPDSSASATSVRQDIPNILNLKENELPAGLLPKIVQLHPSESNPQALDPGTSADPKNIWNEGTAPLLDNLSDPSLGKSPIQSPFPEGADQAKGTYLKSALHPGLFREQKETAIAFFPDVINELPEGQKKSLFVTGTTVQRTPWAMGNEAPRNDFLKSEFNVNLSGQKILLPGLSTDSPMLLAFDEKLDILLGQNSTGEEVVGRSLNDEFTGFGNPAAEKNGAKAIAGGENHPTPDPFGFNELLGSPKTSTLVEETGTPQKPTLSKTEHPGLYPQIAEKVIWSIRNNEERIRLALEPPQLGNLFIELHRNKDEIKATLWADNPKTKEILENNQFQLQKTLEGHGFQLEQYEVFVQQDMGSFPGKEENPVFQGPGSRTPSLQIEEAELPASLEIPPRAIPASGGSQYIDRFI